MPHASHLTVPGAETQAPRPKRKRYREFAAKLAAYNNCLKSNNSEWESKHREWIERECKNGPSGSGIDCGTRFDWDKSTPEKLVFVMDYHHMNDAGYYDGWTNHTLTVTPSLQFEFEGHISGRNRNDIKDYLYEVYDSWLSQEIEIS